MLKIFKIPFLYITPSNSINCATIFSINIAAMFVFFSPKLVSPIRNVVKRVICNYTTFHTLSYSGS